LEWIKHYPAIIATTTDSIIFYSKRTRERRFKKEKVERLRGEKKKR